MTKERVTVSMEVVAGTETFFITLGGPQAHDSSGRDDKFVTKWEAILHGKGSAA
jgi:hypothetical protein